MSAYVAPSMPCLAVRQKHMARRRGLLQRDHPLPDPDRSVTIRTGVELQIDNSQWLMLRIHVSA